MTILNLNTCNMKTRIIFFLFACSLFSLTGCDRETFDEPEYTVAINFTVGSMLKSAATPAEDRVDKIIIFAVDDRDVIKKYEATQAGTTLTISKKVKALYAIANPTSTMENSATLNALRILTCDFQTSPPQSPFIMSGSCNITGSGNINIQLVRMVAKIKIVAPNDFLVESLKVKTHRRGYVFERTQFEVPTFSTVTYTYANISSPVYLVENSGQSSNRTEFEITGKYQGNPSVTRTFNIRANNQDVNILRNTSYDVELDVKYTN